ncbi:MAG: hypothetical protein COB04_16200 [Gammaproteobacteria bacterium]|nr:MAG: hypothetical protein COB04_16200 [Gammaproteobacteria bacterium]
MPANRFQAVVRAPNATYTEGQTCILRMTPFPNAFFDPMSLRVSGTLTTTGAGSTDQNLNFNGSAHSLFSRILYSSGSQQETCPAFPAIMNTLQQLTMSPADYAASVRKNGGSEIGSGPNIGARVQSGTVAVPNTFSIGLLGSFAEIQRPVPAMFDLSVELTVAQILDAFVRISGADTGAFTAVTSMVISDLRLTYNVTETSMYPELFPVPQLQYHSRSHQLYSQTLPVGQNGRLDITLPFTASSATNLILIFETLSFEFERCRNGIGSVNPNLQDIQLVHGSKTWPLNPLRVNRLMELMDNNEQAVNDSTAGAVPIANFAIADTVSATAPGYTGNVADRLGTSSLNTSCFRINLDLSKTDHGRDGDNVYTGANLSHNSILTLNFHTALALGYTMRAILVTETVITLDQLTGQMVTTF